MPKHYNQFTDSFNYLGDAAKSITGIRSKVLNVLNRLLPNRVLSRANIFNFTLDVTQDLATTVLLHVEDSLIEQNILVAQKETSIRGLATLSGHQAVRPISSTGIIAIQLKPNIQTIAGPNITLHNPIFRSSQNNLKYVVTDTQPKLYGTSNSMIYVHVVEGTFETLTHVAGGEKLEKIELDTNGAIENNNIFIWVNGVKYSAADSLYDMKSGGLNYIVKNGLGSQVDVVFGDGVFGKKLNSGDKVEIKYLVTSGEIGNIELDTEFQLIEGVFGSDGTAIDLNSYAKIKSQTGFKLGSNGEHIETTRNLAGYNSRSLTFTRPEHVKAYLSRLSILSHIDVWTTQDDLIYNLLLLPNIAQKLDNYSSYFFLSDDKLTLNSEEKEGIKTYLNESRRQVTSTEILFKDPVFTKYAIFVYIDAQFIDRHRMKATIEDSIAQVMLEATFLDVDMNASQIVAKKDFIKMLLEIPEIQQVDTDIVSEENELARINGFYYTNEITYVGSAKKVKRVKKEVKPTENPNLGFTELGGIQPLEKIHIPIIRGGFMKYNGSDAPVLLDKPLYIFYKTQNGYEEL